MIKPEILVLIIFFVIHGTIGARLRRLVGGNSIDIEKVPYQVSIRYNNHHICGGSLISKRHVLTAAHCVADLFEEPYDEITVITGTNSLTSGGNRHNVRSVTWHDKFTNDLQTTWNNDIAVITLTKEIAENRMQRAIKLPNKNAPVNEIGMISGFGRTETENPYLSEILQAANTTILGSNRCKEFIVKHTTRETQICGLQKKGTGICKGDSGGPLARNGIIVGVSSWNFPCGLGIPDVYTDVYRYMDFINEAMKIS